MESTQTTTQEHTNGNETAVKTKQVNPGYIALVTYFAEPTDSNEGALEFLESKTRTELANKLTNPKIDRIVCVIKGRHIPFNQSRKITF